MNYYVVNTDNFGDDYPDEKFSDGPFGTEAEARAAADKRNRPADEYATRYFKVVKEGYKLQPGFEP
jgi:hypothetical protein